jgi:hypothetical protein
MTGGGWSPRLSALPNATPIDPKGVRANFARLKGLTASPETPISVATGRARERRGTDCLDGSSSVQTRFYANGRWFYQVIAVFKKEGGDAAAALRFVQSFKLIAQ